MLRRILGGVVARLPFMPRRRVLLRGAGYGILGSMMGACLPVRGAPVDAEITQRQARDWLYAVADTFVPRDDDPGAVDAKVPERLEVLLQRDPDRLELYRQGYTLLNGAARSRGAKAFARLALEQRMALLEALGQREDGQPFVERARADVFILFYATDAGQGVVDYRPPNEGYLQGPGTTEPEKPGA